MKICRLHITNYRTLENVELKFPGFYSALSGKNNSGKTNVVRVIRSFFEADDSVFFEESTSINIKKDFPNWKSFENGEPILFEMELVVDEVLDAGLHRFVATFLNLETIKCELKLTLRQSFVSVTPSALQ